MHEENPLMQEEYNVLSQTLSLGLTFNKFGIASHETIIGHCKDLGLTNVQIVDVEYAHARHPKRFTPPQQQGK